MLDAGAHRLEMINMNISSLAVGEGNGNASFFILEEDILFEYLPFPAIQVSGSRRFKRRLDFVDAKDFPFFICLQRI